MDGKKLWKTMLAGFAAGGVTGLFGTGGGMVLVPLLTKLTDLDEVQIFPASVSIMLPVSAVSLTVIAFAEGLSHYLKKEE